LIGTGESRSADGPGKAESTFDFVPQEVCINQLPCFGPCYSAFFVDIFHGLCCPVNLLEKARGRIEIGRTYSSALGITCGPICCVRCFYGLCYDVICVISGFDGRQSNPFCGLVLPKLIVFFTQPSDFSNC